MFLAHLKLYSFMNAYEYSEEATSDKHDFIIIIFCYDWQHFDILAYPYLYNNNFRLVVLQKI